MGTPTRSTTPSPSSPQRSPTTARHSRSWRRGAQPYARSKRTERSRATRRQIVEAGYLSTTITDIAESAGVASQTVYFVFGNKASILEEALDSAIAGDDDPVPVIERKWVDKLRATRDAEGVAEVLAEHAGSIVTRAAAMFRVLQQGAADPEVEVLLAENKRRRSQTLDGFAGIIVDTGSSAADRRRLADVLYVILSEENYLLAVDERGWTTSEWKSWVKSTLLAELKRRAPAAPSPDTS